MTTKAKNSETSSEMVIGHWQSIGQKIMNLAEEIPENKFEYRPIEGVRSCADVLRHVAFWNIHVADRPLGKKGEDTANELPKEEFSSKEQILNILKRSSKDALSALKRHKSGLNPEIAEMLVTFIEHNSEHYGQLVVYARLNRIAPPASRG